MRYPRHLKISQIKTGESIYFGTNRPELLYDGVNLSGAVDFSFQRAPSQVVNLYKVIAHYFQGLVWDRLPDTDMPPDAIEAFKFATWYRAIYGIGVVARQGGIHTAINPRYWFPVLEANRKIGSIIVQPYSSETTLGGYSASANRAKVIVAIDALPVAEVLDFVFSGVTLGRVLKRDVISPVRIASFGDGRGEYEDSEYLCAELGRRVQGISGILDKHENPHFQVPVSAIQRNDKGEPTLALSAKGSVLPINRDDKDYKYISLEADSNLGSAHIDRLMRMLSLMTSIPADALASTGGLPRLESGDAVANANNATTAKTRAWQRDIKQAVEFLFYTCDWPRDQYATYSEAINAELQLLEAGVITTADIKERLQIT